MEGKLKQEFDFLQDTHTSTWVLTVAAGNLLGYYLDIIVCIFIACVTFTLILTRKIFLVQSILSLTEKINLLGQQILVVSTKILLL